MVWVVSAVSSFGHESFWLWVVSDTHWIDIFKKYMGAEWLSGRVLDSRLKDRGFEPHRCHCVVVLGQDTFILA